MNKSKVLLIGNIKESRSKSMSLYLEMLKENIDSKNIKHISPSSKSLPVNVFKNFVYPFVIPKKYDLFHILDHSYGHLAYFLPRRKILITCHDLIPLKFPNKMSLWGKISFKFYISGLKKAKIIITDSKNTKKDIIKLMDIPEEKVKVIPFGFDKSLFRKKDKRVVKKKLRLEKNIVLMSVGNFFYKNTILILKAMKILEKEYDNLLLVKIGGFSKEEMEFIDKNDLRGKILIKKNLTQDEMNDYYNASDILVFPSLYEGFGIPPLEAMACGTPVIASNAASLPEVVGDASIKINPHSIEELKNAIVKILENKKFRNGLIKKGYKNVKRFSWERYVKRLKKIYEEFLK